MTDKVLSRDLPPGTKVRYKPTGDVLVLDRRKEPNAHSNLPGWWLNPTTGGGLADIVIDEDDQWEVLPDTGPRPVTQDWVHAIPLMQQTVLLTAVRGPDGMPKYHPIKYLLRWYRRCVLLSAMDQRALTDPFEPNGGSFTGPSHGKGFVAQDGAAEQPWELHMDRLVGQYLASVDEVPLHAHLHFLHAAEIIGYKHPDERIRAWWRTVYVRLVHDLHLWPETENEMDSRLGDDRSGWLARNDTATVT